MQRKIILLILCFVVCVVSVILLFFGSNTWNHRKNGFVRLFPPHALNEPAVLDLTYQGYYIAGGTDNHIYLDNYNNALKLLSFDYHQKVIQHVALPYLRNYRFAWKLARVTVDSPKVYFIEGLSPSVIQVNVATQKVKQYGLSMPFNAALIFSPFSVVTRVHKPSLMRNVLLKESLQNNSSQIQEAPTVLQKQVDGFFCTDGIMRCNNKKQLIVYLYFYRNEFICLDTNLLVIYRGHTIDTNSRAKFSVANITSEHTTTFSSPSFTVNRNFCMDKERIYVQSALMANNEEKKFFNQSTPIDVYDLKTGRYQFSFYLPDYQKAKASDFFIRDNLLIALYGRFLLAYQLNL